MDISKFEMLHLLETKYFVENLFLRKFPFFWYFFNSDLQFQMFKWKNVAQHEQFIYLHCRAWICTDCTKPETNHACLGDITTFRRRRSTRYRRAVSLFQAEFKICPAIFTNNLIFD